MYWIGSWFRRRCNIFWNLFASNEDRVRSEYVLVVTSRYPDSHDSSNAVDNMWETDDCDSDTFRCCNKESDVDITLCTVQPDISSGSRLNEENEDDEDDEDDGDDAEYKRWRGILWLWEHIL